MLKKKWFRGLLMVCVSCPGQPGYKKNYIRGKKIVVFVSWSGHSDYKKKKKIYKWKKRVKKCIKKVG